MPNEGCITLRTGGNFFTWMTGLLAVFSTHNCATLVMQTLFGLNKVGSVEDLESAGYAAMRNPSQWQWR
jgi:hypothetical protein